MTGLPQSEAAFAAPADPFAHPEGTAAGAPRRAAQGARLLVGMLLFGALLRCATVPLAIVHQADEIWQYLEPGYGLLTGRWIQTWEFHEGVRTFLVPLLLAGPQALGLAFSPHGELHIWLARLACALLSLVLIPVAYRLGNAVSRRHALLAAFVAASWFELVYFSARTSGDAIALSLLFAAIVPVHRLSLGGSRRIAFPAGLLLALVFSVRFQLAPALLVLAIWGCGLRIREAWVPLVLGGLAGLGIDAAIDMMVGTPPLLWIFRNFAANVVEGRAATFGVEPLWWYPAYVARIWGWATVAIVPLALLGARRYPALAIAALAILASHSLIPHKEYRFVIAADALIVLLAAIGSGDLVDYAARRSAAWRRHGVAALCLAWLGASAYGGATEPFSDYWGAGKVPYLTYRRAGQMPGVCGIGEYRPLFLPASAHALINRAIPVYLIDDAHAASEMRAAGKSFNVVVASERYAAELAPAYRLESCSQRAKAGRIRNFCVFVRAGGCTGSAPALDYNRQLTALGH